MVALWIAIHVLVGYELVTGKMQERWSFEWIEGRRAAPLLYWIYVGGKAGALLLIDGYFLWTKFSGDRKKGNSFRFEVRQETGAKEDK